MNTRPYRKLLTGLGVCTLITVLLGGYYVTHPTAPVQNRRLLSHVHHGGQDGSALAGKVGREQLRGPMTSADDLKDGEEEKFGGEGPGGFAIQGGEDWGKEEEEEEKQEDQREEQHAKSKPKQNTRHLEQKEQKDQGQQTQKESRNEKSQTKQQQAQQQQQQQQQPQPKQLSQQEQKPKQQQGQVEQRASNSNKTKPANATQTVPNANIKTNQASSSANLTKAGAQKAAENAKGSPGQRTRSGQDLLKDALTCFQPSQEGGKGGGRNMSTQFQTADRWPQFSKDYFRNPIPQSPFHPGFNITWDFNTTAFLQRPDVIGQPPKLMTWMVKTRYTPPLPEPVRLRVCPEMPCLITTNPHCRDQSAALLWAGQIMREPTPPVRSHPDQVFVFHNHEPQTNWVQYSGFRKPAWKSAFNWTMTYRSDSDIPHVYGKLVKRTKPVTKNYTAIAEAKTKLAAQLVSNCHTAGRREDYVKELQNYMSVDVYGACGNLKCPRSSDDACIQKFNREYKFFFSFESSFCDDYVSEKFFRYMGGDVVVVARGGADYMKHAAPGTFINTADFQSPQALAEHLLHLDSNPEEYVKVLQAKDQYQSLYEDWPLRDDRGHIRYMTYHYGAVAFCQMCQRLWDLPRYQHTVPDIGAWVDKHNCYPPKDLH